MITPFQVVSSSKLAMFKQLYHHSPCFDIEWLYNCLNTFNDFPCAPSCNHCTTDHRQDTPRSEASAPLFHDAPSTGNWTPGQEIGSTSYVRCKKTSSVYRYNMWCVSDKCVYIYIYIYIYTQKDVYAIITWYIYIYLFMICSDCNILWIHVSVFWD